MNALRRMRNSQALRFVPDSKSFQVAYPQRADVGLLHQVLGLARVVTHRPLFDLKPEWEWFTRDGDEVMKVLSRYENVTVLYDHIHREHVHA